MRKQHLKIHMINFDSVAAVDATVVAWRAFKNTKTLPKTLKKRTKFYNFVKDYSTKNVKFYNYNYEIIILIPY